MGKQRPTRRKLAQFFNWRVKVYLIDGKWLEGIIMGVDKHVNLVLKDAEETRLAKVKSTPEKELKRALGMTVVRGDQILYVIPVVYSGFNLCDTPQEMERKNVDQARARSNKAPPPGVSTAPKNTGNIPPGMPNGATIMGRGAPRPGMMVMPGMIPGMMPGMMGKPGMPPMMGKGFPQGAMRPPIFGAPPQHGKGPMMGPPPGKW